MARITVGTHPELLAKSTDTAPVRAVMSLQRQTGKKLADLREEGQFSESLNVVITAFLSLETAGIYEKWDDLVERPVTDFQLVQDPEDTVRAAEDAEGSADPQTTSKDSPPPGSEEPTSESEPPATRSSARSRGSKPKSSSE
jgi:hypothetical protein